MDQARKILVFAVGIILAIAFVGVGVTIFKKSQSTVNDATAKFDNITSSIGTNWNTFNNGDEITGNQLTNLLSDIPEGYSVKVMTKGNTTGVTYYSYLSNPGDGKPSTNLYSISDKTNVNYINSQGKFKILSAPGTVNGIVTSLEFTQQ